MTEPSPDTDADGGAPAQPSRFLFLRRRPPAQADAPADGADASGGAVDGATEDAGSAPDRARPGVLRRRRRQLTATYEQAVFDLGGLAMELHGRGLLAEAVMRRKAAEVADIRTQIEELDARLEDVRRDRRERRQAGRGGGITCPQCGTRSQAGANFCASCGTALALAADAADAPDDAQATTVIVDEQVTTVIVEAEADPQPTTAIPPQSGGDG
ncbi:MAG: hypothetical protein ACPHJV_07525 [Miltoncostaeaceae bacterium]